MINHSHVAIKANAAEVVLLFFTVAVTFRVLEATICCKH